MARAFVAYEARSRPAAGSTSTTWSCPRSTARDGPALLARWRADAQLLVDEVQDVDRAQLRLALLLAAPDNRIFLVGDDDQSIYGWRLADVAGCWTSRRCCRAAAGRPRGQLPVPERGGAAVRLVEHNRERFAKAIRAGPAATAG